MACQHDGRVRRLTPPSSWKTAGFRRLSGLDRWPGCSTYLRYGSWLTCFGPRCCWKRSGGESGVLRARRIGGAWKLCQGRWLVPRPRGLDPDGRGYLGPDLGQLAGRSSKQPLRPLMAEAKPARGQPRSSARHPKFLSICVALLRILRLHPSTTAMLLALLWLGMSRCRM